jgi:hypothetical protein
MEVAFRLNTTQENKSLLVAKVQLCKELEAFLDAGMHSQAVVAPCLAKEVLID